MSIKIKFGTDGWRAIIADDYTVENVRRVALGTAKWLNDNFENPTVVLGFDCRFGGELFMHNTTEVLCSQGIKVIASKTFVSTPMISYCTKKLGADLGVIITASHNPPSYNGYKLKAHFGGPAAPSTINSVEDCIPENDTVKTKSFNEYVEEGLVSFQNFEDQYIQAIENHFDLDLIKEKVNIGYDAMYGAGQNVMKRLFPDATLLHCDHNPSFRGQAPEPIHKNLIEFSETIKNSGKVDLGFATDGDADRIGMYNEKGEFVDSHHIILLLIHYLCHYQKMSGKVVVAFSVTEKIKKMCAHYSLPLEVTKIGFKYIAEKMIDGDVLVGGEESGGIAVGTHVPERDGIWIGLTLIEFMAKTGKSINELILEVYDIIGSFSYSRDDLHITEEQKLSIIEDCKNDKFKAFGEFPIEKVETTDGFKFFLSEDEWVMIRPSGTEPVLRVYCEASSATKVRSALDQTKETILS